MFSFYFCWSHPFIPMMQFDSHTEFKIYVLLLWYIYYSVTHRVMFLSLCLGIFERITFTLAFDQTGNVCMSSIVIYECGACAMCMYARGACTCGKCIRHEKRAARILPKRPNKQNHNDFASANVIFKKTEKKIQKQQFRLVRCDAMR